MSGGPDGAARLTLVRVQREDFDVGAELAALTRGRPGIGGLTSFLGLVRDIHGDARVGAMTLEHFPGMTERELERISDEAHARWPLAATLIVHRFGRLEPGDAIETIAFRKGFTYALLQNPDDDDKFIPPMKGHFYDIVEFPDPPMLFFGF